MSEMPDPNLRSLFAQVSVPLKGDDFVGDLQQLIQREQKKLALLRGVGLVVLVLVAFIVQPWVAELGPLLAEPLFELDTDIAKLMFAPLNAVAVPVALSILVFRQLHRRLFVRG